MSDAKNSNNPKTAIIIAIVTAVISTALNWLLWIHQFAKGKDAALYEHQLSASELFTKNATKVIYLFEFKDRIEIEQGKLEANFRNNTHTDTVKFIDFEQRLNWQNQLQKKYPLIYENYMKGLDCYDEYLSSEITVRNLFDKKDYSMLFTLDTLFGIAHKSRMINNIEGQRHITVNQINDDEIIDKLQQERTEQLSRIAEQLSSEIAQH